MGKQLKSLVNWFEEGGESYVQFRPKYPKELAQYLASICASHAKAIDIGCGNGQLTMGLAEVFKSVIGIDPSLDQINHAEKRSNVSYLLGSAENIPLECVGADLVTVAQAAHWFDLDIFYPFRRKTSFFRARMGRRGDQLVGASCDCIYFLMTSRGAPPQLPAK